MLSRQHESNDIIIYAFNIDLRHVSRSSLWYNVVHLWESRRDIDVFFRGNSGMPLAALLLGVACPTRNHSQVLAAGVRS